MFATASHFAKSAKTAALAALLAVGSPGAIAAENGMTTIPEISGQSTQRPRQTRQQRYEACVHKVWDYLNACAAECDRSFVGDASSQEVCKESCGGEGNRRLAKCNRIL